MIMDKVTKISGVVVPMVTPLTSRGEVDLEAAGRITDHIASAGASLFILGTTGEGPSMHTQARGPFIDTVVKQNLGRSLICVGISDHCFEVSLEQAHLSAELGADLVVAHLPSYYPLSEREMTEYFMNLADQVPLPLVIYNMPITTRMSLPLSVVELLSHHPNIIGIKDSENDLKRLQDSLARWKDRADFKHLTGCTVLSYTALSMGADGIVPSPGNVLPSLYCRLCEAVQNGDNKEAQRLQTRSDDISAIFHKNRLLCHSLPLLKAMMHALDFCEPYVLPPLETATAEQLERVKQKLFTLEPMLNQPYES